MRRRILAFSFFPAYLPPKNGGVERLFRIYAELARRFDVTLLSSGPVGGDKEIVDHGPSFREIRVPKDSHFVDCYGELLNHAGDGDLSGPAIGLATRRFGDLHAEYLHHHAAADIILHDSPFLIHCDVFRGFDGKPRVYNSYNVETHLYGSFHSKMVDGYTIKGLVRELEEETCRFSDLITACSPDDLEAFRDEFAPSAALTLVPNGFVPSVQEQASERACNRLIFLGSAHQPNLDAVQIIRTQLAPRLPNIEFHIVGGCAPVGREHNVVAHGYVDPETKRRLIDTATAAINPMISGSGSSLKIADIADRRLPLLSTRIGARGFDLTPGEHYVPLNSSNLAADVEQALSDQQQLTVMASRAQAHFRERFTWARIGEQFADRLEQLGSCDPPAAPRLVLNDYDSFAAVGGGATRTRGLCKGLSESAPVVFLTFEDDTDEDWRRTEVDGNVLIIRVPKSQEHVAEHQRDESQHWLSTADLVNYRHAPDNPILAVMFQAAAAMSSVIICEHPYMTALPRKFGLEFVYSSQNFELHLKESVLADHPRGAELLALAEEAEGFACAAANFIVAVSQEDARQLSGQYRFTAPIMLIRNGADGPATDVEAQDFGSPDSEPVVIFMGSAHAPNLEAAKWIAEVLAPSLPTARFVIMGGVVDSLTVRVRPNLTLLGQVSDGDKSRHLLDATIAINPMRSGSGSNIKMADFLQHGLAVVTTRFGARGYEGLPDEDVVLADPNEFAEVISARLDRREDGSHRHARMVRYRRTLSMEEGGRALAHLIEQHRGNRKRALYVTYRYNDHPRGGGEAYVVRMVHALARHGWFVDVVSPAAEKIEDVSRFAAVFAGGACQPVPTDVPRVRSGKFRCNEEVPDPKKLERIWSVQSAYEAELLQALPSPTVPALAWGWSDGPATGRWCFRDAALFLPNAGSLSLVGRSSTATWVQIFAGSGELLYEEEVVGRFSFKRDVPPGFLRIRSSVSGMIEADDPRPLGLFVESLEISGENLLGQQVADLWFGCDNAEQLIAAHTSAMVATREARGLALTEMRSGSRELLNFVDKHAGDYDLIVTHNAVFDVATRAVAAAKKASVPSVLLPHFHFEDDFYYFPDVFKACADASATLVTPRELAQHMRSSGLGTIYDHGPGVDVDTSFSEEDVAAFREALGRADDFFLVLGRKAAAKGYREVIRAAKSLPDPPLIVLIGPDDDGEPVESDCAIYLGPQPAAVVRGALSECMGLVNFSRSESFGMVLLEAGLAAKPVVANRVCAAFRDLVEPGINGFLVGADDLPQVLRQLETDSALRSGMGVEGRRKALEHDWTRVEKSFVDLCDQLVVAI